MFSWLVVAATVLLSSAMDEPTSCTGDSLLQTHQQRAARTFTPGHSPVRLDGFIEGNLVESNAQTTTADKQRILELEKKLAELEGGIEKAGEDENADKEGKAAPEVSPEAAPAAYESIPDDLLEKMIVSTQWNCALLPFEADPRTPTCGLPFNDTGLHPARLTALGNKSHDFMNSMRMLFPIGALPCCSTSPHCGAPACAKHQAIAALQAADTKRGDSTCTKNTPQENYDYMSGVKVWPAYHGWGGSYELDVMKHVDILGTLLTEDGRAEPVDLVVDIGANSGFITEKLTIRHFAKNYILVEAYTGMLNMFQKRLGDVDFKKRWFTEQVPARAGSVIPNFEFLNVGVSNVTGGALDLCVGDDTMWGKANNGATCPVPKVALDEMIPGKLSPGFRSAFAASENAYLKVDVEGFDQMALEGMANVLQEERGVYSNGSPRHLVNFIQLELCVPCMEKVKRIENRDAYDVKTLSVFLESLGFETFLMGPRYLPLSHGSWDDSFANFFKDPVNSDDKTYPDFHRINCPGCTNQPPINSFTADLFAMRSTHPRAAEIKLALGSCKESHDFSLGDKQYDIAAK